MADVNVLVLLRGFDALRPLKPQEQRKIAQEVKEAVKTHAENLFGTDPAAPGVICTFSVSVTIQNQPKRRKT